MRIENSVPQRRCFKGFRQCLHLYSLFPTLCFTNLRCTRCRGRLSKRLITMPALKRLFSSVNTNAFPYFYIKFVRFTAVKAFPHCSHSKCLSRFQYFVCRFGPFHLQNTCHSSHKDRSSRLCELECALSRQNCYLSSFANPAGHFLSTVFPF